MAKSATPKFVNFVKVTVHVGKDGELRYANNGNPWATCRVSVSMGKEADGQTYKPSLWLTAKAFTKDGDDSLPTALGNLKKGDTVTLHGRLAYEEYTNDKGDKRSDVQLIVTKLETAEAEAALADEP